jgi:hypothetical protein
MGVVSTASLAHLPLRGIKRVCVSQLVSENTAGAFGAADAAAQLTAALASAPGCTFFCSGELVLTCGVNEMPILLPLLARWKHMELLQLTTPQSEYLTPAALAALHALLVGLPDCTWLDIDGLIPHPSVQLLPALAGTGVSSEVLLHNRMTEAQLMLWCAGGQASKPITVEMLEECEFVGSIHRVRSAVSMPGNGVVLQDWVY